MKVNISDSKDEMGQRAAADGAERIRRCVHDRGEANIVVATGASQFEMFAALVTEPEVPWHKVTGFHLDEYVGLPITHPASFRAYLWTRFISRLPLPMRAFHFVAAEADGASECRRLNAIVRECPIDVAFIGIGENAHVAFNDPPADFETSEPYIVVKLDEACRNQQLGEGWFPAIEAVPMRAVSMSVKQIMASKAIVCTVPDRRKAQAVRDAVEGPVTNTAPASILQRHIDATLYLDREAAALLKS